MLAIPTNSQSKMNVIFGFSTKKSSKYQIYSLVQKVDYILLACVIGVFSLVSNKRTQALPALLFVLVACCAVRGVDLLPPGSPQSTRGQYCREVADNKGQCG